MCYTSIKLTLKLRNDHKIERKPTKYGVSKVKQTVSQKKRASSAVSHAAEVSSKRKGKKNDHEIWQKRVKGILMRVD